MTRNDCHRIPGDRVMVANILTPLGPFPPSFPRSSATYISMWQSTPDVAGTRPRGEADRARHRRRFADCRCCRIKTRFGCFRLGSSQSTRAASEISPNPAPLLPASRAAPSRVFRLLRMATGKPAANQYRYGVGVPPRGVVWVQPLWRPPLTDTTALRCAPQPRPRNLGYR